MCSTERERYVSDIMNHLYTLPTSEKIVGKDIEIIVY